MQKLRSVANSCSRKALLLPRCRSEAEVPPQGQETQGTPMGRTRGEDMSHYIPSPNSASVLPAVWLSERQMDWGQQRTLEVWGFPDLSHYAKTPNAHTVVLTHLAPANSLSVPQSSQKSCTIMPTTKKANCHPGKLSGFSRVTQLTEPRPRSSQTALPWKVLPQFRTRILRVPLI